MKKDSSIIARVATIVGLALGAFALSALAGTWTAPSVAPPGGNVDAPINVGGGIFGAPGYFSQTKAGDLTITGLLTLANLVFHPTGVTINTGDVLTANSPAGDVKWATPAQGTAVLYGRVNYKNYNPATAPPPYGTSADPTTVDPWPYSTYYGGPGNPGPMYCTSLNAYQYCSERNSQFSNMTCGNTAAATMITSNSGSSWTPVYGVTRKITSVICATTYSGDINPTVQ
jgi:hypothetical protein